MIAGVVSYMILCCVVVFAVLVSLTSWFLSPRWVVFTARYGLDL